MTHIIVITGLFTSLVFHLGSKESSLLTSILQRKTIDMIFIDDFCFLEHYKSVPNLFRSWRDFLCDIQFYFVALLWMFTRVISNVSQVYLPLYIMDATDPSQVDRVSFPHPQGFPFSQ